MFVLIRTVRAIFGVIGCWQIIGLLPMLRWIETPPQDLGAAMALVVIKVVAGAIALAIYFYGGKWLISRHQKKHNEPHPKLKKAWSL